MTLLDTHGLLQLFSKLAIDLVSLFTVVGLIYFPRMKDKDYVFTFFVFNLLIFLVCYFMNSLRDLVRNKDMLKSRRRKKIS